MSAKPRVRIDVTVILDTLQRRKPFHAMPARALACAEIGQVEGWVDAHSLATPFYLLARHQSAGHARVTLSGLLSFLSGAPVDQALVEPAVNLPYQDFGDVVQMMAAVRAGVQYLIFRDVQDWEDGPLPVLQPAELLSLV